MEVCGPPQEYKVTTLLNMPDHWVTQKDHRSFIVDSCILEEIQFLINKGVRTMNSCCGHDLEKDARLGLFDTNGFPPETFSPWVAVSDPSIPIMLSLGYENFPKECTMGGDPGVRGIFRPDIFKLKWPVHHIDNSEVKNVEDWNIDLSKPYTV